MHLGNINVLRPIICLLWLNICCFLSHRHLLLRKLIIKYQYQYSFFYRFITFVQEEYHFVGHQSFVLFCKQLYTYIVSHEQYLYKILSVFTSYITLATAFSTTHIKVISGSKNYNQRISSGQHHFPTFNGKSPKGNILSIQQL